MESPARNLKIRLHFAWLRPWMTIDYVKLGQILSFYLHACFLFDIVNVLRPVDRPYFSFNEIERI